VQFNKDWTAAYKAFQAEHGGDEKLIINWSDRYNALAAEKETIKNDFILRYWNLKWADFQSDWEFKYNSLMAESTGAGKEKDALILDWTSKYNTLVEEKYGINRNWNIKWSDFNKDWDTRYKSLRAKPYSEKRTKEKNALVDSWNNKYSVFVAESDEDNKKWNAKWVQFNKDWAGLIDIML